MMKSSQVRNVLRAIHNLRCNLYFIIWMDVLLHIKDSVWP